MAVAITSLRRAKRDRWTLLILLLSLSGLVLTLSLVTSGLNVWLTEDAKGEVKPRVAYFNITGTVVSVDPRAGKFVMKRRNVLTGKTLRRTVIVEKESDVLVAGRPIKLKELRPGATVRLRDFLTGRAGVIYARRITADLPAYTKSSKPGSTG